MALAGAVLIMITDGAVRVADAAGRPWSYTMAKVLHAGGPADRHRCDGAGAGLSTESAAGVWLGSLVFGR